jgi:hypothetical protein
VAAVAGRLDRLRITSAAGFIVLEALPSGVAPDAQEWAWFEKWLEYGRESLISGHKVDKACFDTLKSHFGR